MCAARIAGIAIGMPAAFVTGQTLIVNDGNVFL